MSLSGSTSFTPPAKELKAPCPQPTLYRVLIRPLQAPERTDGGIVLTEKIQKDQEFVTVVGQIAAVGPIAFQQERFKGSECAVGDWVLYSTYGGTRIEMADGRTFQLMNDDQIIAKVDEPEPYRKKLV